MKKILSYILITLILSANFLAPISVGFNGSKNIEVKKNVTEAADCVINSQDVTFPNSWDNDVLGPQDMNIRRPNSIIMNVKSTGCVNKNVSVIISSMKDGGIATIELQTPKYLIETGKDNFSFQFKTGEKTCDGESCDHIWFKLRTEDSATKATQAVNAGPIKYLCLGADPDGTVHCNAGTGDYNWGVVSSTLTPFDSATLLAGKYYYTIKSSSIYSKRQDTSSSKSFDTKPLCEADRADNVATLNMYGAQSGMTYDTTPCELFDPNSKTTTTVEYYTYETTTTVNGVATTTKSSAFYAAGTMTAEQVCNVSRDTLVAKKVDGMVVGDCVRATTTQVVTGSVDKTAAEASGQSMPACIFGSPLSGTFSGCIAQAFYYVFFVPTSYLFALSGLFFDSTFAYSVQDTSYKSSFVVQGWGLVRDLCNMLFIFIMLYVAIGTILSLHSMKTKETIINIVIIGLFINFSLFATQIIIDASNITARVFYNSNAIKITEKGVVGATNVIAKVGDGGIIPLSSALVNKINPQNMIINAGKINDISDTGGKSSTDQSEQMKNSNPNFDSGSAGLGAGTFILIVIMASAVNIVGFTVFLTIGILFIARVVGLWLAMILSPLAFFTYIVPGMKDIKMIGWTKWWPDTLKMAFLAPVFIFFLYIILKFLETDLISDPNSKTGLAFFVATIIPFVFIMILMTKAKKIATDMSGEFGEIVTKAGSAIGGMALGGAVGAGAYAMRGTIGAIGDKVANSDWAKTHGRLGNMVADAGKWTASKSFDARKTALGTMAGKEMGVDMAAKGIGMGVKEGGYAKHKAEITEKRRARAESHKLGNNSKEVQALHKTEEDESNLKNTVLNDTNRIEGMLKAKRLIATDLHIKLTSANSKLSKAEKELELLEKNGGSQQEKEAANNAIKIAQIEADGAQKDFDKNQETIDDYTQERKELNGATGRHADKTAGGKVNALELKQHKDNKEKMEKELADLIKNNPNDTVAIAKATNSAKEAKELFDKWEEISKKKGVSEVVTVKDFNGEDKQVVKSLDGLALDIIPELHHHVEEKNAERVNEYAETIRGRWFNKEANDIAAHEAIMRSEIKKH